MPKSADPIAPTASATTRPRTRTYYVANVEAVCTVFWEENDHRSRGKEVPCPREILPGERVRLMGRVCMRENTTAARAMPVRCPKYVFYAERDDRLGKGEFKLGRKP